MNVWSFQSHTLNISSCNKQLKSYIDGILILISYFRLSSGEIVLNVEAVDSDSNADVRYKIVHPIFVRDKKGLPLVENLEDDFRHVFA